MNYRRLGRTGLKVSEISLGSWLTYGGYVDKEKAASAIHHAYDLGINFFDTANVYMNGEAEKTVGNALKGFPRKSYVLATKVFWPRGEGPNDRGLSRKHIMDQCHASLQRLDVDYIDVYYCHRYDEETPIEETLRALDDLVRQGKVLYIGVSEWTASQMEQALKTADRYLLDRIVVNQPQYNMFARGIENEIIPFSEENGIGQVVWSPLAQGVLTGKYQNNSDFPEDSRASHSNAYKTMKGYLKEEPLEIVKKLSVVAKEVNLSLSQLALAWVLREQNVASAIIGASKPEQITENVQASGVELSDDIINEIEKILIGGKVNNG
ncbi:aldo/keto reductase [Lottiidibacillus patelloidae]|uniref:Aldo/keto reductase n=1 Tax=Lottiidibacillus patelloidae TaxID=2670334 RepID=A0A263BXC6_9BACI|nr:aldo/keto reductase family protein [Lottiidibacillus patelloidae]OZM58375.1 aldo/keto reductase [Lottiidibacillus patelloidae]